MRNPWSRSEINAVEVLYHANWRWQAISVHVSAVGGTPRTANACRKKAQQCQITLPERHRTALAVDRFDADLADLMVLDYSVPRMTRELSRQHGRAFAFSYVWQRLRAIGGSSYAAWRQRAPERRSRSLTGICRKGQGRRSA